MLSLKTILTLATATTASALPITAAETSCCFHLSTPSNEPLQQNPSGGSLHLSSSYPSLEYCFKSNSPTAIRDPQGSACYIDPQGQVICLDVTPGFAEWALDSKGLLSYDGETKFLACEGDGDDGEVIWSVDGQKTGCREVTLQAKDKKGTC